MPNSKLGRLCSVVLPVPHDSLEEARDAYAQALGTKPKSCVKDKYYSFKIANCELCIMSDKIAPSNKAVAYWEVDEVKSTIEQLIATHKFKKNPKDELASNSLGTDYSQAVRASVEDNYSNLTGVITNPPFYEPHSQRTARWAAVLGLAAGVALLPRLLTWLRTQ